MQSKWDTGDEGNKVYEKQEEKESQAILLEPFNLSNNLQPFSPLLPLSLFYFLSLFPFLSCGIQ